MNRRLALIGKARGKGARDVPARLRPVVTIVAIVLPGQENMPGVVIVVVPLCAIAAPWRIGQRIEQARLVVIILDDQMNEPAGSRGQFTDRAAQILQQGRLAWLDNGVDRVESQPV